MMKWTGQFRASAAKKPMHTEPFALRQYRGFATGKSCNRLAASKRGIDYFDQPAGLTGTGQTGENLERHPSQSAVVCPQCNGGWPVSEHSRFATEALRFRPQSLRNERLKISLSSSGNQSAFAADRRIQKLPPPQDVKRGKAALRSSL